MPHQKCHISEADHIQEHSSQYLECLIYRCHKMKFFYRSFISRQCEGKQRLQEAFTECPVLPYCWIKSPDSGICGSLLGNPHAAALWLVLVFVSSWVLLAVCMQTCFQSLVQCPSSQPETPHVQVYMSVQSALYHMCCLLAGSVLLQ